ncbi:hypothetical protein EVAR_39124_1 [Eumeta japonica]|uniref:Uncharacterized protein n=1 Tax=Eumeta variegata TaxID=151549 RepID=A0A4C1X7W7_EUMVA|nr:hypothetical protein EVAR_39124_1 [Eumeta japonica]
MDLRPLRTAGELFVFSSNFLLERDEDNRGDVKKGKGATICNDVPEEVKEGAQAAAAAAGAAGGGAEAAAEGGRSPKAVGSASRNTKDRYGGLISLGAAQGRRAATLLIFGRGSSSPRVSRLKHVNSRAAADKFQRAASPKNVTPTPAATPSGEPGRENGPGAPGPEPAPSPPFERPDAKWYPPPPVDLMPAGAAFWQNYSAFREVKYTATNLSRAVDGRAHANTPALARR